MARNFIPALVARRLADRRWRRYACVGRYSVLAACLCAGACSTFNSSAPGVGAAGGQQGAGETTISGTAAAPRGRPDNTAIVALVRQSDSDLAAGKKELAAAALERALRLTPADASLWHRLARIRQEQGRWRQSIELAQKSNSLAAEDRTLQAGNWLLIARAQSILGNGAAAEAARRRAAALQGQPPPR